MFNQLRISGMKPTCSCCVYDLNVFLNLFFMCFLKVLHLCLSEKLVCSCPFCIITLLNFGTRVIMTSRGIW